MASVLRRDVAAVVTLTVVVIDTSAQYPQEGKGSELLNEHYFILLYFVVITLSNLTL